MSLTLPYSLSPSKVSAFTECAMAFRFSVIDGAPEPSSAAAERGTLVHAALERLFALPAAARTVDAALLALEAAFEVLRVEPDYLDLALDAPAERELLASAEVLVQNAFLLEDPTAIEPIGLELKLEAAVGDLRLRGIIDRLDRDADGNLVVIDYKTGRVPSAAHERASLGGVHFYSLLCEQLFGVRPVEVRLHYLAQPVTIVSVPSEQSTRALQTKVRAIWAAVEKACDEDDFRPRPTGLCDWCSFKAFCPAFGGDPADARLAAEQHRAERRWARHVAQAEARGQSPLAFGE